MKRLNIKKYKINSDSSVDVDGHVDLKKKGLTEIPIVFNEIKGISTVLTIN